MPHALFDKHRATLDAAVKAIHERGYWAAYAEMPSPKVYGETAMDDGKRAFESYRGQHFALEQPGQSAWMSSERSPYGAALDVSYPVCKAQTLIDAGLKAMPVW